MNASSDPSLSNIAGMVVNLTIGSCVSVRSSRYEAHGKFGDHERCIRELAF